MGLFSRFFQRRSGNSSLRTNSEPSFENRPADPPETSSTLAVLERPSDGDPDAESAESPWWEPPGNTLFDYEAPARPDLTTEARAIENLLISMFDGHNLNLPPLLNVAERVLVSLRDPRHNLSDLCRVISEDQVITAAVMRMANSPLYRGLNRVASLNNALTRLGTAALKTLMVRESLRSAMFARHRDPTGFAERIWKRSLASAAIMQELARFTSVASDDAALYGLLHDIGNVVVLRTVFDQSRIAGASLDEESFEYLCSECHQEFGELIAASWKLPPEIAALVSQHHLPPAPDDPLRTERLMLAVTDMIGSLLGYAPYRPYALLDAHPARELGLAGRSDFIESLRNLPDTLAGSLGE
jgi:HD-like signal output (HDOD) protein